MRSQRRSYLKRVIRKSKCVFLDRDGVVNKKATEGDYIKNWNEFIFFADVKESIKRLNKAGFLVVIITKQRGIAKDLMTEEDLKDIHSKMIEELKRAGQEQMAHIIAQIMKKIIVIVGDLKLECF